MAARLVLVTRRRSSLHLLLAPVVALLWIIYLLAKFTHVSLRALALAAVWCGWFVLWGVGQLRVRHGRRLVRP